MADLVVENARIWSDGCGGFARFAAVKAGRFIHVGERDDALITSYTQRVDAGGRIVIPGIIDCHAHMIAGGRSLGQLLLDRAKDKDQFISSVAEYAGTQPVGSWILGWGWSVDGWDDPTPPTRAWIDDACGNRPALLRRMDIHSAVANSVALDMAGITRDGPPDPRGGVIDRDPATGEPTGMLREAAVELIDALIPKPTPDDEKQALRRAMHHAVAHGVTTVGDVALIEELPVYEAVAADEPICRLRVYAIVDDWAAGADAVRSFSGRAGWIESAGLKAFVDGSLGSRTAYMTKPYLPSDTGEDHGRGVLTAAMANDGLRRMVRAARRAGLQPMIHAIGDAANHLLLDTYEEVYAGQADARCRTEHAQHLLADDIARFGELGVIASMQPLHKAYDAAYVESLIGEARCELTYAFRSLLDAGAPLAFGSDWPVVSIDPFLGIEAAVTGKTIDGTIWRDEQSITVAEALRAYTSGAAYALRAEHDLGRIAPGYRADFVVLNESPFDPAPDWSQMQPVAVYIGGRRAESRRSGRVARA
ncbi:MAG: amidohydrolase [Phycisphaerales bacterium]|nr:amidohydrolase [Phycisphaerales bacterium]